MVLFGDLIGSSYVICIHYQIMQAIYRCWNNAWKTGFYSQIGNLDYFGTFE